MIDAGTQTTTILETQRTSFAWGDLSTGPLAFAAASAADWSESNFLSLVLAAAGESETRCKKTLVVSFKSRRMMDA